MVTKITNNVLEPFLSRPDEKIHLAEIAKTINTPHPTARQWLNKLEEQGILRKEHKGRQTLYSLNKENPLTAEYLVIAEKNKLIKKCEESLILKELVHQLNKELPDNTKAVIFGSTAEDPEKSEDIDLLIIGKENEKQIKEISNKINKKIHLINTSTKEKITITLKKEIIKKHLIIKGSEELVRWMIWQA